MASRTFHNLESLNKNTVIVSGNFYPQGAGVPTKNRDHGYAVVRNGPGQFLVTLGNRYDGLIAAIPSLQLHNPGNMYVQFGDIDVVNNRTLQMRTFNSDAANTAEVSDFSTIADTGVREVFTWTPSNYATATDGDYVYVENQIGTKYAVVYDKTTTPSSPSGAPFNTVPAANVIRVPIITGDTATSIATKTYLAIRNALANITVVDGLAGTLTLTNTKMGTATDPSSKNINSAGTGSVVVTVTAQGAASNLNGKYITFNSANDAAAYYAWYNVNGEGVDPAVAGRTGVQVNLNAGDSANNVATATRNALTAALAGVVTITGATNHVIITNAAIGPATDATVGTSGFVVNITQQGSLSTVDITADPNNSIGFTLELQQRTVY